MEMAIGVLRHAIDYETECPLCGQMSLSVFASGESDTERAVVYCSNPECEVRVEVQLGTLRNDEVRRALDTLMHDSHAPVWFKQACAVLHRAACVIDQVEEEDA
jgi:transcription elongation factor Elf1